MRSKSSFPTYRLSWQLCFHQNMLQPCCLMSPLSSVTEVTFLYCVPSYQLSFLSVCLLFQKQACGWASSGGHVAAIAHLLGLIHRANYEFREGGSTQLAKCWLLSPAGRTLGVQTCLLHSCWTRESLPGAEQRALPPMAARLLPCNWWSCCCQCLPFWSHFLVMSSGYRTVILSPEKQPR